MTITGYFQRHPSPIHRVKRQVNRFNMYHASCLVYLCFISIKHQEKMKTSTIIFAAVLTLQAGILFAGNENSSAPVTNEAATITMASLSPATPAEATCEEFVAEAGISSLVPVTPSEAAFEDMPGDLASTFDLAPVTPVTADFEDVVEMTIDISTLAPSTPASAEFE
jgi:hypothetical protein